VVCASYLPDHHQFQLDEPPSRGRLTAGDLVTPRVVDFRGPRGEIETLVYEPPASRRRDVVVVALHGGPVDQWSAVFTPELQLFAGLGATVVAPNYHGSVGYGHDFVRALEGGAGVVDVEDVVAVVTAVRGSPRYQATVLYGHSYGGFLGLLVAATHPWLCEAVVAVAPFISLSSMQAVGKPSVRRLVHLLGGAARVSEEADVLKQCGGLRAKLLIAHGDHDDVIPIEQSYALCDQLRAYGYQDGRNLWFLPLQAGHAITHRAAVLQLYQHIELFLSEVSGPEPKQQTWAGGLSSCAGGPTLVQRR
jgi:dipeptidyl aminopeptidase/acylaminoacyl peptidase